jgi:IS30 family transposase
MSRQRKRPRRFTGATKRELWRRWKAGETLDEIGRALSYERNVVWYQLQVEGGVEPKHRHRSARALTLHDREEISRGISAKESINSIARRLGRYTSTVSREIARNGGLTKYRAATADEQALQRARRPKRCKLATSKRLRQVVSYKLQQNWSPQQISGWLWRRFWGNPKMQISHETIYRTLFVQARGALKKELQAHLRTRRAGDASPSSTLDKRSTSLADP